MSDELPYQDYYRGAVNQTKAIPGSYACTDSFEPTTDGSPACGVCRCPAGSYADAGSTECSLCPEGRSVERGRGINGVSSCQDCRKGSYATHNALSSMACTPCAPGRYSDDSVGNSECHICESGKYSAEEGRHLDCFDCLYPYVSNEGELFCGTPSSQPTGQPTVQPTVVPTSQPSGQPTLQPTAQPTGKPTIQPSSQPTMVPTSQPSSMPSMQP